MPVPLVLAAITLSLSDFSGAQVHPLPIGDGLALDVQTTGTAALAISGKRSSFTAAYSPSWGWVDVTRDPQMTLVHGAQLGYAWGYKRLHLTLGLTGSLGTQSYLAVGGLGLDGQGGAGMAGGDPGAAPAPGQDPGQGMTGAEAPVGYVPQTLTVRVGSLSASAGLSYVLSRRWTLGLGVGYTLSGGLGDSEQVLPKAYGPNANATATYLLTRRDTLATSLAVAYTKVPTFGSRYVTSTLMETWGHAISPRTQSSVGVGITHLRSRGSADADYEDAANGAATASIAHSRPLSDGATLGLSAGVGLGTPYNPVLGIVQQQLTETAGVSWQKDRTSASASVGASQSLPESSPTATRVVHAGALLGYAITEYIGAQLGVGWSTQLLPNAAAGQLPPQWLAFAGLAVSAPPLEL